METIIDREALGLTKSRIRRRSCGRTTVFYCDDFVEARLLLFLDRDRATSHHAYAHQNKKTSLMNNPRPQPTDWLPSTPAALDSLVEEPAEAADDKPPSSLDMQKPGSDASPTNISSNEQYITEFGT